MIYLKDVMTSRLKTRSFVVAVLVIPFFLTPYGLASAEPRGLRLLEDLERALVSLAEKVRPAVVSLSPYVPPSPSVRGQGGFDKGRPANAGAGVIIDAGKGLIVTNSHVVKNSNRIQVTLLGGERLIGRVLGTDDDTDLAVVRIPGESAAASVRFGDSSQLKVGQMVIAVGNPYGLNNTMTFGIVSGLNRENVNLSRYEDFIQTDASINPGNSGGPLLNIRGEVIGVNTAIINYAQSIGFAIPSNIVKRISRQLIENGEVRRGWLGVGIEPVDPKVAAGAGRNEGLGVMINSVFEGDPAQKAGLKVGDVILKIGGIAVNSPTRMIRIVGAISPGQTVHLDIFRDGQPKMIPVKLDNYQKKKNARAGLLDPGGESPALGIELQPVDDETHEDPGVGVKEIIPGSAAEKKGLQAGDRILAVNGADVSNRKQYENLISKIYHGAPVFLLLSRNDKKFHLTLVREN